MSDQNKLTAEGCCCAIYEQWLDVEGFEGRYKVSNKGRIYSVLKDELVKPASDKLGYKYLTLSKNRKKLTRKVHRLVAAAFLIRLPGRNSVNHIDKKSYHNCVCNLQYVSARENNRHARGYKGEMPAPIPGIFKNLTVRITKGKHVRDFTSPHLAIKFLKVKMESINSSRRLGIKCRGYNVEFINKDQHELSRVI